MTRKRFKKLLMAKGCDRNKAEAYVLLARSQNKSYEEAYEQYKLIASFDLLSDAVARMTETFSRFVNALGEATRAFLETFLKSMRGENK